MHTPGRRQTHTLSEQHLKTAILAVGTLALAACSDATTPASSTVKIKPLATISAAAVVIVTEADVLRQAEGDLTPPAKNWMLYVRTNLPAYPFPPVTLGTGEFTVGPDTPPAGTGSFRTLTPDLSARVFLANYDHVGTALTSINGISYSTYKTMGATAAFPAINIQIDIDGGTTTNAGELRTLVFEPVLQPGG